MSYNLPPNERYDDLRAISWSDMVAIEKDVKKWLAGGSKIDNTYTRFGTHVHSLIEHGKLDVRTLGNPEAKFAVDIPIKGGSKRTFTIVGRIDDHSPDEVIDYKTARKLWTRKQVEDHAQLDGYALLVWKHYGKMPKKKTIISLETAVDEDAGLYLTGKTAEHTVEVKLIDLLKIQSRFQAVYWKVINELNKE